MSIFKINNCLKILFFTQLLCSFFPRFIFIQAILITFFGIIFTNRKYGNNIFMIISFLAGSETYYKQTSFSGISESIIPWEFSKYLCFLICFLYFIQNLNISTNYRFRPLILTFICLSFSSFFLTLLIKTNFTFQSAKFLFTAGLLNYSPGFTF